MMLPMNLTQQQQQQLSTSLTQIQLAKTCYMSTLSSELHNREPVDPISNLFWRTPQQNWMVLTGTVCLWDIRDTKTLRREALSSISMHGPAEFIIYTDGSASEGMHDGGAAAVVIHCSISIWICNLLLPLVACSLHPCTTLLMLQLCHACKRLWYEQVCALNMVGLRILFINTHTDERVVLTHYVTGNQLSTVRTMQLMKLHAKFGFTWKRTHWPMFCSVTLYRS